MAVGETVFKHLFHLLSGKRLRVTDVTEVTAQCESLSGIGHRNAFCHFTQALKCVVSKFNQSRLSKETSESPAHQESHTTHQQQYPETLSIRYIYPETKSRLPRRIKQTGA